MAGIISNVDSDVQKLRKLKNEIEEVKKALKSINIKVDIDIAEGLQSQLKSLTVQYKELVNNIAQAEAKVLLSAKKINGASEKIIQAQEKMAKTAGIPTQMESTKSQGTNAVETAIIQAQAKAYEDLKAEINGILGTREANVKRMVDEMNAIRLINAEIKKITKSQGESASLSSAQQKRLEQLNNSLLTHKTALSEVRQTLNNNVKLDNAAATSKNGLSQSLSRMRIAYRELTEEERNSPIGKELLASINQADAKIKELDATIGNHQRNVGNYGKQWNGLQYQMQMVARELPNFAINPQIGIMSLTNNIPYLVDELKKAKDEHKAYIAEVKAGNKDLKAVPSVGKQVLSSLLNWQTAIVMGITLITAYRKEISEWVGGLFEAKDAIKSLKDAENDINAKFVDNAKGMSQQIVKLKELQEKWKSLGGDINAQKKFVQDAKSDFDNLGASVYTVNDAESLLIKNTPAFIEALKLRAQAAAAKELSEERYKEYFSKRQEALNESQKEPSTSDKLKRLAYNLFEPSTSGVINTKEQDNVLKFFQGQRIKGLMDEAEAAKADAESYFTLKQAKEDAATVKINSILPDSKAEIQNKDFWTNQKNSAISALDAIDSKQKAILDNAAKEPKKDLYSLGIDKSIVDSYKNAVKAKKEAEEELKAYPSTSDTTKQESAAEKLRKEQEKYNLLASKQELERIRTSEDLENQVSQSKIDAMSSGFEKEQAQRELNNKKEIQSLQRQKEDYVRTYVQAQKELFDTREELTAKQKKGYVKKSFDPSSVSVDTSAFDTIIDNTTKRQQNDKLHEQEDSWDEYLIKYGTFQGKKAALTRKYQKLIDEEPDAGKAAALQKELEEAISSLDVDKLKQEINWELVFGDLSKVSKKELDKVNVQLKNFRKSSEYQNMAVEQKKVIDEALDSIRSAIIDKGGILGDLPGQLDNLRKAQEELEKAQDEYNDSLKNGTLAEQEAAKKKQNTAEQNVVNAKANANKSSQKAIDNITGVTNAITQLGEADMSLSEFGNAVGSLVDALSQSGSKIGGIIAAILSLLDQFSEDGGVQFGKNLLENVANAIGGTVEVPFKMLGIDLGLGGADYSGYNEMVAQYDNLLEIWDELLDKKKAYIKESYGAEAAKAGEEALEIAKNELEVQRKLAAERLSAGSSAGSHSQWYRMWKGSYKWEGKNWRDVAGEIEKQLKNADLGDVNFDSMDSMTKMTSEQLQWIKENYAGLWSAMDGEFRDHLNNIIQYGDTEKDIIESIQEQLTQTTFDSVYDSFVDKLMDMKASASDFSDDLNEMFMRSLLSDEMGSKYYDKLKGWYAKWSEAMKLEDETRRKLELDSLREEYESYVDSAIQERNDLADTIGYTGDSFSSSQSATSKGFQTMSQDTGEELNGRFTALQTAGEEIKNQNTIQSQSLNLLTARADTILSVNTETRNIADETRTILANSYLELVQISENTGAIIKPIQQMQKDMAEVKKNTSKL